MLVISHRAVVVAAVLACVAWPSRVSAQFAVSVTPKGANEPTRVQQTSGFVTQLFTVTNTGSQPRAYTLSCHSFGEVTCTGTSKSSTGQLSANGGSTTLTATYNTINAGMGRVYVIANDGFGTVDSGYVNVTVNYGPGMPRVAWRPASDLHTDYGACAVSCFTALYSQSTVPYYSLDTPRNVTLVYNGDRADPRGFVNLDVAPDTNASYGMPEKWQLQVLIDGAPVTFVNGETALWFAIPDTVLKPIRIGGQFAAAGYADGSVHTMLIKVSAYKSGVLYTNQRLTKFLAVNWTASTIARGWQIGGLQRAYPQADGSLFVVEGDGSALYFKKEQTGQFTSPDGDFSEVRGSSGWTRWYPDSSRVVFNAAGLMTAATDRWGVSTTFVYSGGKLTQIKDPLSNAITLGYDANGLHTITEPTFAGSPQRVTTVTVDASKRLTGIKDFDNVSTTFGYDGSLRLQTMTDRNGKVTTLAYEAQSGKLSSITSPAIPIFGSPAPQMPVTQLAAWQKVGVPYGPTSVTPFAAPKSYLAYAQLTEPGGAVNKFTANRMGQPLRSLGAPHPTEVDTTTVAYTPQGLPARIVHPGYGATDFDTVAYNASGLPVYVRRAGSTVTNITYGSGFAQPTNLSGTGQPTIVNTIGANGRLVQSSTGGVIQVKIAAYDTYGRPTLVRDGQDTLIASNAYVTTGLTRNLLSVTTTGNRTTTYGNDNYGRVNSRQLPGGMALETYFLDSLNRLHTLRQTQGPNTWNTVYAWDNLYNTGITDRKGQVYAFLYNALGMVIRRTDPALKRDTLQYSIDGDLRRVTTRRDLLVTYTYDASHRLLSQAGNRTLTRSYARHGRDVTATSPVSTETIYGSLLGATDSAKTVAGGQTYWRRYSYTAAGLLSGVTPTGGPGGFANRTYGWDTNRGLQTSITLAATGTTTLARDNRGFVTSRALPSSAGTVVRQRSTLVSVLKDSTTSPYKPDTYGIAGLDGLGRLNENLSSPTAGNFYAFDALGRLVGDTVKTASTNPPPGCPDPVLGMRSLFCAGAQTWTPVPGMQSAFTYDAVGNRTDSSGTYTAGNRQTAFKTCTYVPDNENNVGSRTCAGVTTTFYWSAEGTLDSVNAGGTKVFYAYDAFGRLTRRKTGTTVRFYVWDQDNLLAEVDSAASNTLVGEYSYYGTDELHAERVGGVTYYAHQDLLGSTTALTDATPATRRTYRYDLWGKLTGGTDPAALNGRDRARWKGALWFDVGTSEFYYMRARWYDPGTGRFLSEDPIGLAGGMNPSIFAGGEPVNAKDPSGLGKCLLQGGRTVDVSHAECETLGGTWATTLPGTVIKGSRDWPSPTSKNFGNPCARGGTCAGGISWSGVGGPLVGAALADEPRRPVYLDPNNWIAFFQGGPQPELAGCPAGRTAFSTVGTYFGAPATFAAAFLRVQRYPTTLRALDIALYSVRVEPEVGGLPMPVWRGAAFVSCEGGTYLGGGMVWPPVRFN